MYSYMHIYLIENVKKKNLTVLFSENNVSFVDICSLIIFLNQLFGFLSVVIVIYSKYFNLF